MKHIAAIGEVMVELAPLPDNSLAPAQTPQQHHLMKLGFAGDTYNTSIYLARFGLQTDYVTHLGDDHYSQQILQHMTNENIGTDLIQCAPGRTPGLYIIRNTPDGEREFFYWRKESPARDLFSTPTASETLFQQLKDHQCVYFSGITLAIISAQARQHLFSILQKLKAAGVTIAFDSNYRPRLWRDQAEARETLLVAMQHTDIALLTLDDEYLLWGDNTVDGCKKRYQDCTIRELILKRGAEDVVMITADGQTSLNVPPVDKVIDTTGAGDSFNAGYLAARLQGHTVENAVQQGIRCASVIIRHRGAVIEKSVFDAEFIH